MKCFIESCFQNLLLVKKIVSYFLWISTNLNNLSHYANSCGEISTNHLVLGSPTFSTMSSFWIITSFYIVHHHLKCLTKMGVKRKKREREKRLHDLQLCSPFFSAMVIVNEDHRVTLAIQLEGSVSRKNFGWNTCTMLWKWPIISKCDSRFASHVYGWHCSNWPRRYHG